MTEYAERNVVMQGGYYTRHVSAMTIEGLHDKSSIAAELAHRDMEIDRLREDLQNLANANCRESEMIGDMGILLRRLVRELRKIAPDNILASLSVDYLIKNGISGNVMREKHKETPEQRIDAALESVASTRRLQAQCQPRCDCCGMNKPSNAAVSGGGTPSA